MRLPMRLPSMSEPLLSASGVRRLLCAVVDSSMDGVVVLRSVRDARGSVVDFEWDDLDAVATRMLPGGEGDVDEDRVSGVPADDDGEHFQGLVGVAHSGGIYSAELSLSPDVDRRVRITANRVGGVGVVVVVRDVSEQDRVRSLLDELQQRHDLLERQALHDPLTGLANRLLVESRLEHGISRLDRHQSSLAVMFIDLDGFKTNDQFGHAARDLVLGEVGRRFRSAARSADTVGRVGGDEFVVICEDIHRDRDVDRIAQRFVAACATPSLVEGQRLMAAASVGVAVASSPNADAGALLRDAHTAMYRAKAAGGGGRVEYFDGAFAERLVGRRDIENGLRQAIEGGDVAVAYEPIVASGDLDLAGVQARLQWRHPQHGLIDEATLNDAAWSTGATEMLGERFIELVVSDLAQWGTRSGEVTAEFVVVDVDATVLGEPGFADRLANTLDRHQIDPSRLGLAIDGDYIVEHLETVAAVLEQLGGLGVRIVRDGVGAAGSPLTYLGHLPIDVVRLDASWVDRAGSDDTTILGAICDAARTAGREIIAPAVSSNKQLDTLTALGVDFIQGPLAHDSASVLDPFDGVGTWFSTTAVNGDELSGDLSEPFVEQPVLRDSLTGLPNRLLVETRLAHAIDRLLRRSVSLAVLFIDLDRFRVVNDSLGHAAGDVLLREVARRLQSVARPADTVARFGGDEFVVLCEDLPDKHTADGVVRRYLNILQSPFRLEGRDIEITASIGAVTAESIDDVEVGSLLRDADTAMYQAKAAGGSTVRFIDTELHAEVMARLDLEVELRRGIDTGQLEVFYQPIVAPTGTVEPMVAVEALVRWHHPERGLVYPNRFISVAEETGLIVALGDRVLEQALRQLAIWQDRYPHTAPGYVTVNVAAAQLAVGGLASTVLDKLAATGLVPEALCVEVTETSFLRDPITAKMTLDALSAAGVKVALDDFGTGYSSLAHLRTFPIDIIKIDRTFTEKLADSRDDQALVQAISAFAESLGNTVVAEGVETSEQLDMLHQLGVHLIQGDHISPAVPADAITELLQPKHSSTTPDAPQDGRPSRHQRRRG